MDSIIIFFDRIYRIDGIFFACGESLFGRRPLYPDDPVDPVQLLFKDKNPFLSSFLPYFDTRCLSALYETTPKWHSFFFDQGGAHMKLETLNLEPRSRLRGSVWVCGQKRAIFIVNYEVWNRSTRLTYCIVSR
jgi:hypothetical protein